MKKRILITGGAGFIGSHLADHLIQRGYTVRILDNLSDQVHGINAEIPAYLHPEAHFIKGDVRDHNTVSRALQDIDAVFHLAGKVGVGQSMYQMEDYMQANNVGTAVLLEEIIKNPIQKLIVASSMSIYGEGLYQNANGTSEMQAERTLEDLKNGEWEPSHNGQSLRPVPTPEWKAPNLSSIYALSKYDQEKLCLITGKAYHIPTVAMRFFNVYGTRQALSNPYTGVLAIFASRLLNGNPPLIFEDGEQKRDFIHVKDVAGACIKVLESPKADNKVFNVGSGNAYTINSIAKTLSEVMGVAIPAKITGKYRIGDIRHCYADCQKIEDLLNFSPEITLAAGLAELNEWLKEQVPQDNIEKAEAELSSRGLTV